MPHWPIVVRPGELWGASELEGGRFGERRAIPPLAAASFGAALGVFCVDTTDPVCALTYDDGPHPVHTPRILDVLAERGDRATFFVLARQAARHPDIVRRIVAEGHELALHGDDHASLRTLGTAAAARRIRAARREVQRIAGVRIRLYRPPYGHHTLAQALAIRALGLRLIIWSGDADDWLDDAETAIAARAVDGVFPGAILLLHDDRGDLDRLRPGERAPAFDRAEVARQVIDGVRRRGYRLATVGDLLAGYPEVRSVVRGGPDDIG